MNPLYFFQKIFLQDKEKIMKIKSKSRLRNITRCKYYSQLEVHVMLKFSLNDIQLLYTDTDSFVLNFSEGNVSDEHIVCPN